MDNVKIRRRGCQGGWWKLKWGLGRQQGQGGRETGGTVSQQCPHLPSSCVSNISFSCYPSLLCSDRKAAVSLLVMPSAPDAHPTETLHYLRSSVCLCVRASSEGGFQSDGGFPPSWTQTWEQLFLKPNPYSNHRSGNGTTDLESECTSSFALGLWKAADKHRDLLYL